MSSRPDPPPSPLGLNFPSLPILGAPEPRRSTAERYGALFYLGLGGLVFVVALVGWFICSAWSLRDVWADIYLLHEPTRPLATRLDAARRLSGDPRVTDSQRWEIAMRRPLPPEARYLLADAIGPAAVAADPRGFGLAVARSADWPAWLRIALVRPIAVAATEGLSVDRETLAELAQRPERTVALWARYARAVRGEATDAELTDLRATARAEGLHHDLAARLVEALDAATTAARRTHLDQAHAWVRDQDLDVAALGRPWDGAAK